MIDYQAGGNVMGIYGEELEGKPHVRNYSMKQTVEDITTKLTGKPPYPFGYSARFLAILLATWPLE